VCGESAQPEHDEAAQEERGEGPGGGPGHNLGHHLDLEPGDRRDRKVVGETWQSDQEIPEILEIPE
jgi:hypothetical protein